MISYCLLGMCHVLIYDFIKKLNQSIFGHHTLATSPDPTLHRSSLSLLAAAPSPTLFSSLNSVWLEATSDQSSYPRVHISSEKVRNRGKMCCWDKLKRDRNIFLIFLIAFQQNEDVFVLQSREAKTQKFEQDFFFHPRRQKSMYPKLYLPPVKRSSAACLKGFGGERPLCIIHARTN